MRELSAMPDNLLNDLGISRYQIADVVNQRGAFAKLPTASTSTAVVAPPISEHTRRSDDGRKRIALDQQRIRCKKGVPRPDHPSQLQQKS